MIDINAYAGPWPFRALPAASPAELAALLQDAGIARALVSPLEALFYEDPQVANERLAATLPPGELLMLCAALSPAVSGWRQSLQEAQAMGARAVKLHPNYHAYEADLPEAVALLQAAGEAGLPVLIQLRMQDTRAMHPLCQVPDVPVADAVAAAGAAPQTRVILGGIRYGELLAHAQETAVLPNLWFDLSQVEHSDGLRQAVDAVGADRLLLGTHAPLFNLASPMYKLAEGMLTPEERAAITRENARRVLGV